VESFNPEMNGNGRRIAIGSTAPFAGRNPDGSDELALLETTAGTTTPLTKGPGGTFGVGAMAINGAGTRVAFETDADLLGDNTDGGFEIYLRDFGATGVRLTQVTEFAVEGAGEVDMDASGQRLVFTSKGNPTGDNDDGNREIFLALCSAPPAPALCDGQLVTVDRGRNEQPTTAADVIRGTNGPDTVGGRQGNDRFCGRNGNDTFNGGAGNDRGFGQDGNDRVRGDGGNDLVDGSTGADALNGGSGGDTCRGGPGTDTATACESRVGIP
jgi:hypothetical protein